MGSEGSAVYSERLDHILRQIREISSIPSIALRVMQVANDQLTGAADLAAAVGEDPALAARVIRTVNSPAYGLRKKIGRVLDAVIQLGFKQVRNLAMTALISELFRSFHTFGAYDRTRLWHHLVGVAVGARSLAMRPGSGLDAEEAFLAGLLHDIGIVLEDQYAHDGFARAVTETTPGVSFFESERRHLGFDHTELGGRVAVAWRFPEAVLQAITWHHRADEYEGPEKGIVFAVAVANWVCAERGLVSVAMPGLLPPSDQARVRLGVTDGDLKILGDDIETELSTGDLLSVA